MIISLNNKKSAPVCHARAYSTAQHNSSLALIANLNAKFFKRLPAKPVRIKTKFPEKTTIQYITQTKLTLLSLSIES